MALDRSENPSPTCIFLTGVKHCGKTTVGRLLAGEWGVPFFDLDDLVEAACADETGIVGSCRDIYREYGKPAFLRYETEAALRLAETARHARESGSVAPVPGLEAIAALGGGTVENTEAMAVLKDFGLFVLLDAEPGELFERIKRGGIPPFLRNGTGVPGGGIEEERHIYARFLELYSRRMKLYRRQADIIIDTRGKTPREITESTAREIAGRARGSGRHT